MPGAQGCCCLAIFRNGFLAHRVGAQSDRARPYPGRPLLKSYRRGLTLSAGGARSTGEGASCVAFDGIEGEAEPHTSATQRLPFAVGVARVFDGLCCNGSWESRMPKREEVCR
jgi:hypothetical protein